MNIRSNRLEFIWLSLTVLLLGCGGRTPEKTTPVAAVDFSDEPKYGIDAFGALEMPATRISLPYLRWADGRSTDACFTSKGKPVQWQTANPAVLRRFEANADDINAALIEWLRQEVFKEEAVGLELDRYEVTYSKPVVRHVPPEQMDFKKDQSCITGTARDFPAETAVVTTLFGVKELRFSSPRPIAHEKFIALRKVARGAGVRLTPENAYTPALDRAGKPRKNEKGQKLFNSPEGKLVTRREMPPFKQRALVSWRLVSPAPLFIAFGTQSKQKWRKTLPEAPCEVFVVFDDAKPQAPSCSAFNRVGFGATRSRKDGEITIKAATDTTTVTKSAPFGQASLLVLDDALLVWVTPFKVEEGARLRVESLWMDNKAPKPIIDSFPLPNGRKRGKQSAAPAPAPASKSTKKSPKSSAAPPPPGY